MSRAGERPSNRVLSARQTLLRIPDEGHCAAYGKVRYRTRKLASGALAVARRLPTWSGGAGHAYRCRRCGSWHFSHLPAPPTLLKEPA